MKYLLSICVVVFLLGCATNVEVVSAPIPVEAEHKPNAIDTIVQPYRSELADEMNKKIAVAPKDFERGKPNGALNNWSTDATLYSQTRKHNFNAPVFSLLNWGGLRNSISKGDVTIGDIFKLMPFDNQVVWVEMPIESLDEITTYLTGRNGEPIGGAKLIDGKIIIDNSKELSKTFWVITSDYLMKGGDNMSFFEKKISHQYSNQLLRDVFIEEATRQGTLVWSDEKRIQL